MPEGFQPGHGTFSPRGVALRFEMSRSGTDFLEAAVRPDAPKETSSASRIAFVYGAGAGTDEVYFTWHGDGLNELPVAWLNPVQQWGASLFDPYGSGDFSRPLTPRCIECHNTWGEHVPGTMNRYRPEQFILGVTCENCHGPGREHVAFHRAHPEETRGQSIVRPSHLTREQQIDVCAQCHSNAMKNRTAPFSFRPGESPEAHFKILRSERPEDNHVANQVKYLKESKCFQESEAMTCTTCHDPHRSERRKDFAEARNACLSCHRPADCSDRERLPVAVQNQCSECHMPRANKIQVRFRTEDDDFVFPAKRVEHRIAVYPAARMETLIAYFRMQPDPESRDKAAELARSLADDRLAEAERYRKEYRYLAAIDAYRGALNYVPAESTQAKLKEVAQAQARIDSEWYEAAHEIEEGNYVKAIEILRGLLKLKPDFAKVHGELGKIYAVVGRREDAAKHLRAVAQYDPDDPYGHVMLGWLAYLDDRPEEALEHYRKADKAEPYSAKLKHQMGLALMKLARWDEAGDAFRLALEIDPNHAGACQGLSHVLREGGLVQDALRYAVRAARLTEFRNADILVTLAETYDLAGRSAEAEGAAEKALDAAQNYDPRLVPQIRRRVDGLRKGSRRSKK